MQYYGKYVIEHRLKPIPSRSFDWEFWHDDYDGAPDSGDRRCGCAPSLEEAKAMIDEIESENADE